jgi:hypothetical protein
MRKLAAAGFVVAWPLAALAQQANGRGNEQVHGGDVRRVVKVRHPWDGGRPQEKAPPKRGSDMTTT